MLRNSERILSAAVLAAAADGWAGLAPTAVARLCGMSQRAVQSRYPHRPDLGAAVWTERSGPALRQALDGALAAAGLLDGEPSQDDFREAMGRLSRPSNELRAAVELLIISMFEPVVRDAVRDDIAHDATDWCTPRRGQVPRALAARRAYLIMVSLGLLAAGRRQSVSRLNLTGEFDHLFTALQDPASPGSLPTARPEHVTTLAFDTGDPILDALLVATLDQVGELGFDGATSMAIAGAAGVSETTIFLRYPTKLAMFVDAAARQQAIAFRANEEFTERVASRHGRAVAEAVTIREFLHPDLARPRAIYAEELRVSWHDEELRQRQEAELEGFVEEMRLEHPEWSTAETPARFHMAYATGLGYALLPLVAPEAWSLPFDVITRPLTDR